MFNLNINPFSSPPVNFRPENVADPHTFRGKNVIIAEEAF